MICTLFAEKSVPGEGLREAFGKEPLGLLVGDGNRRVVRLVLHSESFALITEGEGAGLPGEFTGTGELTFIGHSVILS